MQLGGRSFRRRSRASVLGVCELVSYLVVLFHCQLRLCRLPANSSTPLEARVELKPCGLTCKLVECLTGCELDLVLGGAGLVVLLAGDW